MLGNLETNLVITTALFVSCQFDLIAPKGRFGFTKIYLEEISDGFQARRIIKSWMTFYNTARPHSALDRQTPDDAYWAGLEEQKAA